MFTDLTPLNSELEGSHCILITDIFPAPNTKSGTHRVGINYLFICANKQINEWVIKSMDRLINFRKWIRKIYAAFIMSQIS